jgi:alkylation response protein AidB-like acyl-CoA dehydrogenase
VIAQGLAADPHDNLLEQSLERYLRESCSMSDRAASLRSAAGFSRERWSFFAEMGLLGLPFPEQDGGYGGSLGDVMGVLRLLGRALAPEPYLECILIAGRLLAATNATAHRAEWLAALIAGERLLGLAHFERGDRGRGEVRQTTLRSCDTGLVLDGVKLLVPVAGSLDAMLVTARDEQGGLCVCLVPRGAAGVQIREYRVVDGRRAGEVRFEGVRLAADARLGFADVDAALDAVLTWADAALCAEAVGCMQALYGMTLEHARTRRQFGRPIGSFQVLKHRLVDCHTSIEQALGLLGLAARDDSRDWTANVAAARAFIDQHAVQLGHEAIQIHGGMGLTDELAVSHYHKRITMIAMLYGDRRAHIDRHLARRRPRGSGAISSALDFDRILSRGERAFRDEVRAFLAGQLTPEIRSAVRRQTSSYPEKDVAIAWQQRLNAKGWLAPHWPVEVGGTGWTPVQRFLFDYECAVAGAPEQVPMGYRYVGPVIAHFGSEWQKSYFLPRLLASEHYWAQGFSEPGAGSDLAGLATTAVLDGDHYVINGSKMWTTHAHHANWLFCLARTERTARPQEGISFFLIDMRTPGIRVEPIPLLAVDHEVNQVFLDDVRVPVAHRVGEAGRGWEYAKFLLELERGGTFFCGRMRHEYALVEELVETIAPELRHDRIFMHRLAGLEHRLMALELLEFRAARAVRHGGTAGVTGSMTKLLASELQKDITETAMHVACYGGAELVLHRPLGGPGSPALGGFELEAVAMPRYLNMRVASIYGGSSEIQREIIAKHALGMR